MATSSGNKTSGRGEAPVRKSTNTGRSNANKSRSSASGSGRRSGSNANNKAGNHKKDHAQAVKDSAMYHEIWLIVLFIAMIFLFFCNFGLVGAVGNKISGVMFGLFGFTAYVAPILTFLALSFWFANEGNPTCIRKMAASFVLFLMVGIICELLVNNVKIMETYDAKQIFTFCSGNKKGGGIIAGTLAYFLHHNLETVGTVLIVILLSIISGILLTEKSFLELIKNRGTMLLDKSREDALIRKERKELRREELEIERLNREEERASKEDERRLRYQEREEERRQRTQDKEEERRLKAEEKDNSKILRMEKKVSGVSRDTALKQEQEEKKNIRRSDVHEITYNDDAQEERTVSFETAPRQKVNEDIHEIKTASSYEDIPEPRTAARKKATASIPEAPSSAMDYLNSVDAQKQEMKERMEKQAELDRFARNAEQGRERFGEKKGDYVPLPREAQNIKVHSGEMGNPQEHGAAGYQNPDPVRKQAPGREESANSTAINKEMQAEKKVPKTYIFPPLSKLQKGAASTNDNSEELKETAIRLRDTLHTFGVNVTITDISQGPSVTRYELQPEQGVKVSKIVGLSDDIKLNLAATDIRIEAPIPGKAAIGIEVPNKENMMVALRDLLESKQFQEFDSKLAFAVGKDIAGQTVVADIAKMPHMLIAGSTGSGKSVCINTLIMSILYKAHPDDVKLIMVDPKVVELSVYNGIPHLLIPVVTDPKKASAALHWAVSEMEDRYRKFADYNVRDLKGYNKKLESMRESGESEVPNKLPQIVIIVDELADLMMVCPGEVEESICRLAQLARACGIHLIIATQRPSVDVITGLIKANMPSRVAFAVSSGVDSRTILDMVGAEKLLGKGDMLFYPQGYSKPARIQGAFVSDKEVSDVVEFLKNQMIGNVYADDIQEKINSMGSAGSGAAGGSSSGGGSGLDEYFEEAGKFIIDKDKASIGGLQRVLKVGFNRAARIMDQLCEYGVVGEEEGTKPRKVLMTMEQFEQLLEEISN